VSCASGLDSIANAASRKRAAASNRHVPPLDRRRRGREPTSPRRADDRPALCGGPKLCGPPGWQPPPRAAPRDAWPARQHRYRLRELLPGPLAPPHRGTLPVVTATAPPRSPLGTFPIIACEVGATTHSAIPAPGYVQQQPERRLRCEPSTSLPHRSLPFGRFAGRDG
jgi:hypothetical protein